MAICKLVAPLFWDTPPNQPASILDRQCSSYLFMITVMWEFVHVNISQSLDWDIMIVLRLKISYLMQPKWTISWQTGTKRNHHRPFTLAMAASSEARIELLKVFQSQKKKQECPRIGVRSTPCWTKPNLAQVFYGDILNEKDFVPKRRAVLRKRAGIRDKDPAVIWLV